jgi:hypothetical protein
MGAYERHGLLAKITERDLLQQIMESSDNIWEKIKVSERQ